MKTNRVILASASPRRQELLKQIGISFEVMPSQKEEKADFPEPRKLVEALSAQKAEDIREQTADDAALVIGADTVVCCDGMVLGKPKDEEDACSMLSMLQGRKHQVYTGVTLCWGRERLTFSERTEVEFYPMSREQILFYISTKEPMDKAGAYGIQGLGAMWVKGIEGDYNNVVGLPVGRLYQEMTARGLLDGGCQ